jgi:hypothetical protein
MDAMITKYTVEAFTAGLALAMSFGVFAFYFCLGIEKVLKNRKAKGKAKR